jgi:ABC-2 type transport system permease protein
MSVATVARKDFSDAVRSKSLWFLSVLFVLFALLTTYAYTAVPEILGGSGGTATSVGLVVFLASITSLFVSLTAIVIAYKSIAGERESGSIALLLGLPHTRADVLLGKVLGRTAVLVLPILIGFTAASALAFVQLDSFAIVDILLFVLVTVVFALVYVSIVVGLSAATDSSGRASALAVGFFFLFELLWDGVSLGIVFVTSGLELPTSMPDWFVLVNQLPPSAAYVTALNAVVPDAMEMTGGGFDNVDALWGTPWLGVVVLGFWIVVPLAIGYSRFSAADL